ncbi:DUF3626 domain-containing protein, partial [Streptomyces anthocyanicus]
MSFRLTVLTVVWGSLQEAWTLPVDSLSDSPWDPCIGQLVERPELAGFRLLGTAARLTLYRQINRDLENWFAARLPAYEEIVSGLTAGHVPVQKPDTTPASPLWVAMVHTQSEETDALDRQILRARKDQLTPGTAEYERVQAILDTYPSGADTTPVSSYSATVRERRPGQGADGSEPPEPAAASESPARHLAAYLDAPRTVDRTSSTTPAARPELPAQVRGMEPAADEVKTDRTEGGADRPADARHSARLDSVPGAASSPPRSFLDQPRSATAPYGQTSAVPAAVVHSDVSDEEVDLAVADVSSAEEEGDAHLSVNPMPLTAWFDAASGSFSAPNRIIPGQADRAIAKALTLRDSAAGMQSIPIVDTGTHGRKGDLDQERVSDDRDLFLGLSKLRSFSFWKHEMDIDSTAEVVSLVRYGQRIAGVNTLAFIDLMRSEFLRTDGIDLATADKNEFAWLVNNFYDTARHSQMMVPSGRDLIIAGLLISTEDVETDATEEGARLTKSDFRNIPNEIEAEIARTANLESSHHALLRQRLIYAREDLEIFEDLQQRRVWKDLSPEQVSSLVVIERHGRQLASEALHHLLGQLNSEEWEWANNYPQDDKRAMGEIIDRAHAYVREEMDLTVNVKLDREDGGLTVFDRMIANHGIAFRNTWEVGVRGKGGYLNRRGGIEELLGYSASVKRKRDPKEERGTVEVSQGKGDSGALFDPQGADGKVLPKYAALSFPDFPGGGAYQYGAAVFRLKPHIRERVSFTPQDSLDGSYKNGTNLEGVRSVTGANHLLPLLARGDSDTVRRIFAEATGFRYDSELEHPAGDQYMEAQVHGDIAWTDIDLIRLLPPEESDINQYREYAQGFEELAQRYGFSFRVELLTPEDVETFGERLPDEPMVGEEALRFHADRLAVRLATNPVPESRVNEHITQLMSLLRPYSPEGLEAAFQQATNGGTLSQHLDQALEAGRLTTEAHQRVTSTLSSGSGGRGRGEPPVGLGGLVGGDAAAAGVGVDWYVPLPDEGAVSLAAGLVHVPREVEQPVAARLELTRLLARVVLHDPGVAARVVDSGVRVYVVGRGTPIGDVMRGAGVEEARLTLDGRLAHTLRAYTDPGSRTVFVAEENLLGVDTRTAVRVHSDGYSSTVHELAHLLHTYGLTDDDRALVRSTYQQRLEEGADAVWADGPRRSLDGEPADNYSSLDPEEYFAQATNAYFHANTGHDPLTGRPRNNGTRWIQDNEPGLLPLLTRVYGTPTPHHPYNPTTRTAAE